MKSGAFWGVTALLAALAAGLGHWSGRAMKAADPAPLHGSADSKATSGHEGSPRILYYRNPMGLPDTSPTPKKDPMGMDYIPVYEAGATGPSPASSSPSIQISPDKVQKLGVRTEIVQMRSLGRQIRVSGRVEPDERRLFTVTAKFDGYVDRLYANVSGQFIGKGSPLLDVYSPELVSAQHEYVMATQGAKALSAADPEAQNSLAQLAQASLTRLRNWDISSEQIQALAQTAKPQRTLSLRSPVSGIITEKSVTQGMRFMAGEALFRVADLSKVWVVADVFEQDIASVSAGTQATVKINAYPKRVFSGPVTYVYPTLNAQTRTVPVRIEVANDSMHLKPGMFAQVEWAAAGKAHVLAVPSSAVIDSGTRRLVLIQTGSGRFEAREIKVGDRSDRYIEVLEGVQQGESVVVSANFLIDAESNLQAAISGFGSEKSPGGASHFGQGKILAIDAQAATVTIDHGPIPSLKWPQMSMEFTLARSGLLGQLSSGSLVEFSFVERGPGEWVIIDIKASATAAAGAHTKH